jgi:hypothetical protein
MESEIFNSDQSNCPHANTFERYQNLTNVVRIAGRESIVTIKWECKGAIVFYLEEIIPEMFRITFWLRNWKPARLPHGRPESALSSSGICREKHALLYGTGVRVWCFRIPPPMSKIFQNVSGQIFPSTFFSLFILSAGRWLCCCAGEWLVKKEKYIVCLKSFLGSNGCPGLLSRKHIQQQSWGGGPHQPDR